MKRPSLKKILVVEDDPDIQLVTSLCLQQIGSYEVEICGSARQALEVAPTFLPDLILLDVMMPVMDGVSALQALREIPTTRTTPAVFMTARVQPAEIARYKALGAVDVIAKPFEPESIAEVLGRIWKRLDG